MTEKDLQLLLYRRESESLDFKREQYEFVDGKLDKKAELLKDVLAMANAWRQEPAHILIGAEELPQGKARIVGIPVDKHVEDASLQEFVNKKTNRPVRVSYDRVEVDGLHVGVIRLEHPQDRPVYLNERFGPLEAKTVYIRRGSSTDKASPEEIFAIGEAQAVSESEPVIRLEFGHGVREEHAAEMEVTCRKLLIQPPGVGTPPSSTKNSPLSGEYLRAIMGMAGAEEKWQEKAARIVRAAALTPVRLWMFNDSAVNADDVHLRIDIPQLDGVTIIPDSEHPKWDRLPESMTLMQSLHDDPSMMTKAEGGQRLLTKARKLQPGVDYYTGQFFVGADREARFELNAQISADNLRKPASRTISLRISLTEETIDFRSAEQLFKKLTD